MMLKGIGAGLILLGSAAFGCSLAGKYRQEEAMVRMLLHALKWMERDLRYRLTPLPELCRQGAMQISGHLRRIFLDFAQNLEQQTAGEIPVCMKLVLDSCGELPGTVRQLLTLLGTTLGCFDLTGQLEGLQEVQAACEERLNALEEGREQRVRSYQTLSLCAGAALVILLF